MSLFKSTNETGLRSAIETLAGTRLSLRQNDFEFHVAFAREGSWDSGAALAGVVQWQNGSFPSCIRGFDSLRPLHACANPIDQRRNA
jgi:hypothetical protein